MRIYGEVPFWRRRQILSDVAVVLWLAGWTWVGIKVNEVVNRLGRPGRSLQDAGDRFSTNLDSAAELAKRIPFVGGAIEEPFKGAASAGRFLERSGRTQADLVGGVALWLGVLLALIPILYMLIKYVPSRVRWIREATAAGYLRIDGPDLQLFALRAIATRPLHELRRACPDPAAALAAGDYEPLARLELGAMGLRLPEGLPERTSAPETPGAAPPPGPPGP